jgi:2-polyprenyl-3-methyl-5-hydroxy-6-metoxy-1,4-benzoquinol methylase
MLGERYKYDGKPIILLNPIQEKTKDQIEAKINSGYYRTEKVPCAVCEGKNFEHLSEKDRFGLPLSVVICRDCGLIQTNPRINQDSYSEFYKTEHTRLLHGQDKPTRELFLDQYFHSQKIYRYIEKFLLKNFKDMFVLEVGCGAGGILAYFRDRGCQIFGIDLDEDCIRYGRKNYNLNLCAGTLDEYKFERSPDIIILSHVLEHLLEPRKVLNRLRALVNPDGLLYVEVPGARNMTNVHNDMNFLHFLTISHTYHFSSITLRNFLITCGFDFIQSDERMRSLSRPVEKSYLLKNDYETAVKYLKSLEFLKRYLPISPFKIKRVIESAYCWVLQKTKLYPVARVLYRKIIGRTEPKETK